MRCFVGIPLPEAYQELLDGLRRHWRGRLASRMSWTRSGNWHLTLKFLGDVPEERLPALVAALDGVDCESFALQGGKGGFFPQRGTPRVVWVGLSQGSRHAAALARAVDDSCAAIGFEPERRPYSPHLTVARVRRAERDPWDAVAAALGAVRWPVTEVDRFVLWRSDLSPQGAAYTPLHTVRCAPA